MKNTRQILGAVLLGFVVALNFSVLASVANADVYQQAAAPTSVTSGTSNCSTDTGKICNPIKATSIDTLLSSLVSIVKFVAAIVLVVYFIFAGFKYVTARGDEGKIKEAHKMLTWTAVGGAILLGAEVIQKLITGTINQLGTGL
jgi:heme/copper-type cytochrome/quinol oxidase subunit 2